MSEKQTKRRRAYERGEAGEKVSELIRDRGWRYWLSTRPPRVRRLAQKFPPGTKVVLDDRSHHVLGYSEDGKVIVSAVDPTVDYAGARAAKEYVCGHHLRRASA